MDFVAGCVGGAAGCLASHPLDTVKVRLQCCQAVTSMGTWQCFRQIVQNESFSALYKGLASPLSTVAAINSVCFGSYGAILRRTEDPTALTSHFVAGAGAGLVICPLMCPMELAKCKLQMQSQHQSKNTQVSLTRPYILHQRLRHHHTFSGPVDCLRAVYRQEGYIGLNRGMLGLIVREVPAIGTYFACYEWFQKLYRDNMAVDHCPLSFLFLAGGSAGCLSWASSYPADVIKSRLQCDGEYDSRRKRFRYRRRVIGCNMNTNEVNPGCSGWSNNDERSYASFTDFSDADDNLPTYTSDTHNCVPLTIQDLSTTSSSSSSDETVSSIQSVVKLRKKKPKKRKRKRCRTPEESDEVCRKRAAKNDRQRQLYADRKKKLDHVTRLLGQKDRELQQFQQQQFQKLQQTPDYSQKVLPWVKFGFASQPTYYDASSVSETTGYNTDTNFGTSGGDFWEDFSDIGYITDAQSHHSCSTSRRYFDDEIESDVTGYLTDGSKDPFLS